MKNLSLFLFFLLTFLLLQCTEETNSTSLNAKYASLKKAKELLTTEDGFTDSWSQFDINSRLQKRGGTKEELLQHISAQALEWKDEEIATIDSILAKMEGNIVELGYKVTYPKEVFFIKTTADEEGGAGGYTRGNYIVIKDDLLDASREELEHLIIHEIFHIISRHDAQLRADLYGVIGFKMMKPIAYPDTLINLRITNPDAIQTDAYITLKFNDELVECMMILFSDREYTDGSFFDYLNIGFLKLKGDRVKEIDYKDGIPVIYQFGQVNGFFEQVGANTQYIIHPEEILADNFVFNILQKEDAPSQGILDQIGAALRD